MSKARANADATSQAYIENIATDQNLSGTYSTERLYFNDSYKLTGDVNVTGHLALGSVADSDVVITNSNDSDEREITGGTPGGADGLLESGRLMNDPTTSLTGMTGELGSTVTFPDSVAQDYKEGLWTPYFVRWSGGAISANYTKQTGYYTRVGNLVTCIMQMNVSVVHSQGTSYLGIRGMPFGPSSTYDEMPIGVVGRAGCLPAQFEVFAPHSTHNDFYFYKTDRSTYETSGNFTSGEFIGSITYMIA